MKYLKSEDLTNDVVQDTFLKVWNYRSHIDSSQAIKPLIVTFSKRIILNMIRDEKRKILKHLEIWAASSSAESIVVCISYFQDTFCKAIVTGSGERNATGETKEYSRISHIP